MTTQLQKVEWTVFMFLKNRTGVWLYKDRKAILPSDPLPETVEEFKVPLYRQLNRKERRDESRRRGIKV